MTHKSSNPFKNDDLIKDENEENLDEETSEDETSKEVPTEVDNSEVDKLKEDYDNYRKRQEQERASLINYGTESALKKLLEVLDNFERGQKTLAEVDDCEKVKESFNLVHKQVCETLAKLGLEEIKAIGEEFDPNFHEAVMQTPTSEHPEHTVISELQKGYKMGDKVLRPTLVNVATAE